MIRTNLMKNRLGSVSQDTAIKFSTRQKVGSSEGQREALVKIFLMLIFVVGLMLFENSNVSELDQKVAQFAGQVSQLTSQLQQRQGLAQEALTLQRKIQTIDKKIQAIRQLSKIRLRELKALDSIQSTLPEKVWLTRIDYRDQTMQVNGGAVDDGDLTNFIKSLEESVFFKNVILKQSQDVADSNGSYKGFFVTFNVEVGE